MDERTAWMALGAIPGVDRATARRLVERLGSPIEVFRCPPERLAAWLRPAAVSAVEQRGREVLADAVRWRAAAECEGIRILVHGEPGFPGELEPIPDAPLAVYLRGALPDRPMLAIVGSRRPTPSGRRTAARFGEVLGRVGAAIVSGLAYGIDAAAHEGALEAGAPTVAVLASGVDRATPAGNRRLARRILDEGGAWLSEHPPGHVPRPYDFPERNRLISGLARASLVVEARESSGSLWTARHALEQGKDVAVVPGPIDLDACRGSNRLLREGAVPVLDEEDLRLLVLPEAPTLLKTAPACPGLSPSAARILARLADGPVELDTLAREIGGSQAIAAPLLELELAGLATREGACVVRIGRYPLAARPVGRR